MFKKIGKKAGVVFMILSLLSLIGCASLNQRQAKQIEKKLSEMYEGKTFEVLALGNRWGTLTNDTVTANVREVKSDVVFIVKMNTKGEIVANSYPGSSVNRKLAKLLNQNLKDVGFSADSLIYGFGGKKVSDLDPDIPLSKYISEYKPDYFSGYLVIKENPNNTGEAFIRAFRQTYEEIQKTHLQANVWVIHEESFEEVINKFSRLPEVSNDWFEDKNTLSFFKFGISKNGEKNLYEDEVDKLLRGGD